MTDHRIRQLRFLHVVVAAFAAVWIWPDSPFTILGLVPLALFMPVFGVDPCSLCSSGTTTATIQIDITGFTSSGNGCGDCSIYNVSTVLVQKSPLFWLGVSTCGYATRELDLGSNDCYPLGDAFVIAGFSRESGTNKVRLDIIVNNTDSIFTTTGGGTGQNCQATETNASLTFSSGVCDFSVVNFTLTPIT